MQSNPLGDPPGSVLATKDGWQMAAVVLGVCGAVYAVVRWPLWWSFQRIVGMAIEKDLAALADTSKLARANADILTAHEEAIKAMGVALREIPRMSGVVGEMTIAVKRLDSTLQALHQDIRDHGEEIGRVTGLLEAGWQGEERRRKGRRQDDPPLSEEQG